MIEKNKHSTNPKKKEGAEKLEMLLDGFLNNANHSWYLNKLSPEEKAARDKQREEFQKRYSSQP